MKRPQKAGRSLGFQGRSIESGGSHDCWAFPSPTGGNLDTHGFAILDRLRAWLPQTRSLLMDRQTLLEHRERWGVEDRPTRAALTRLTTDEHLLYSELVTDGFGERIRLEQERINWDWAQARLASDV